MRFYLFITLYNNALKLYNLDLNNKKCMCMCVLQLRLYSVN